MSLRYVRNEPSRHYCLPVATTFPSMQLADSGRSSNGIRDIFRHQIFFSSGLPVPKRSGYLNGAFAAITTISSPALMM
jgi:hypothetical protein